MTPTLFCAAEGCKAEVTSQQLMCRDHWLRLPSIIQREVYHAWRNVSREPEAYREARAKAIEWTRAHPLQLQQGRLI